MAAVLRLDCRMAREGNRKASQDAVLPGERRWWLGPGCRGGGGERWLDSGRVLK